MSPLSLIFGMVVGLSLGMTGGGGAIFAVPLLVYGLGVSSREAVGVSLVTVGATAMFGFLQRIRERRVEFRTGLLFAAAGMLTAPAGAWLAGRVPEALLLVLFGGLMLAVAVRMWLQSSKETLAAAGAPVFANDATCERDSRGVLKLSTPCALLLCGVGLVTGILTGLFGVGGGFLIVPALIVFSRMGIQRAVGTSLLVIALISVSGLTGHLMTSNSMPFGITILFLTGSVIGMLAGTAIARRLPARRLHQVFAIAIVIVGLFVIARNVRF